MGDDTPFVTDELAESDVLLRRFIAGSAVLNRMKGEIDTVIRSLLGFVPKTLVEEHCRRIGELSFSYAKPQKWEVTWRVGFHAVSLGDPDVFVEGYVLDIKSCEEKKVYFSTNGAKSTSLEHVQKLHKSLEVFLVGMAKAFPKIRERWSHILAAADYQSPS